MYITSKWSNKVLIHLRHRIISNHRYLSIYWANMSYPVINMDDENDALGVLINECSLLISKNADIYKYLELPINNSSGLPLIVTYK